MVEINKVVREIKSMISEGKDIEEIVIRESNYTIIHFMHSISETDFTVTLLFEKDDSKFLFCPIQYQINYNQLDDVVNKILIKNGLSFKDSKSNRWGSFFIEKQKYNSLVADDSITKIFENQYNNEILPFFKKWHNLNVLYEYIKDKTEDELWDILGQFAPMKKAVILKLCNDSNYQSFMDNYFQKQKEYFEEDPEDIKLV
ncbi:hypothetical protein [Capnocytophaga stomatis]|uniref:DUF4304 domain-containing protein n=1 Tax=Capnocytophaga stomatis TaxID=1848904 RepID=A0ABW8QFJ1_9FLAO